MLHYSRGILDSNTTEQKELDSLAQGKCLIFKLICFKTGSEPKEGEADHQTRVKISFLISLSSQSSSPFISIYNLDKWKSKTKFPGILPIIFWSILKCWQHEDSEGLTR